MNREISPKRFEKFDFDGFESGDTMMFCHECNWQSEPKTIMKNICPNCDEHLYLLDLTKDIIENNK